MPEKRGPKRSSITAMKRKYPHVLDGRQQWDPNAGNGGKWVVQIRCCFNEDTPHRCKTLLWVYSNHLKQIRFCGVHASMMPVFKAVMEGLKMLSKKRRPAPPVDKDRRKSWPNRPTPQM